MGNLTKREINMLLSFGGGSRYWRSLPVTAEYLWNEGYIKPTKFGMGNFQLTDLGRSYLKVAGHI